MTHRATKLILFTLSLLLAAQGKGQDYLVDWSFLGTKTKAEMFLIFFQQVDYDVNLYKITYVTQGSDQLPDTASGLIVVPVVPSGTLLPLVMFEHGTTSGPTDVPSQLRGGYEGAMAYAGMGFITFAPDFLGLGDSRGFHPYLHAATQASASLDMLNAGLEWLDFNPGTQPAWDPNFLFLTGYSQGGHASMALHRELEWYWGLVYPVTAATHMSGPYDLSGVMRDLILADSDYGDPAYIAYIALGFQAAYGTLFNTITDIFKEPFASAIDSFANRITTLGTLNGRLIAELSAGGNLYPKRMFQDHLLDDVTSDPNHPFNLALANNDVYNWRPEAPTRLYYCSGDEQVPYQNSLVAEAAMNALGAPDVLATDFGAFLDHTLCVFPAGLSSIDFFQSFLNTSSGDDLIRASTPLAIYPTPALDEISILWEKAINGMSWQLFTMTGQTVGAGYSPSNRVQVEELPDGMYILVCTANEETRIGRFIRL